MKLNYKLLIGIIILLLILLGLNYMWPFSKKSSTPTIGETKTFSCPGMEGFTFEYPIFKGWYLKKFVSNNQLECFAKFTILPDGLPSPTAGSGIKVTKIPELGLKTVEKNKVSGIPSPGSVNNPNGIRFEGDTLTDIIDSDELAIKKMAEGANYLQFYLDDFGVRIEPVATGKGFSKSLFFQTVINSFRATEENGELGKFYPLKPDEVIKFAEDSFYISYFPNGTSEPQNEYRFKITDFLGKMYMVHIAMAGSLQPASQQLKLENGETYRITVFPRSGLPDQFSVVKIGS